MMLVDNKLEEMKEWDEVWDQIKDKSVCENLSEDKAESMFRCEAIFGFLFVVACVGVLIWTDHKIGIRRNPSLQVLIIPM